LLGVTASPRPSCFGVEGRARTPGAPFVNIRTIFNIRTIGKTFP